jgi:tetratricopeptide (TPR) repeat protein
MTRRRVIRPLLPVGIIALLFLGGLGRLQSQGLKVSQRLKDLEAAAQRDSNDPFAHYNLALGYWSKKHYDDAERELKTSVLIEPRLAEAWLALGALPYARRSQLREETMRGKVPQEWTGPLRDSQRLMRHAFVIDPLVDLMILGATEPSQGPMLLKYRGVIILAVVNPFAAFEHGHYSEAFQNLDGWVRSRPRESVPNQLLWYHGLAAAHIELFGPAIFDMETLLQRAQQREQTDSFTVPFETNDYRYVLATFKERVGQLSDAVRLYREALESDLGLYMAHVHLAEIYASTQQWDSALTESREAILTNPEDPSSLLTHGILLTRAGQLAAAEDTLRRAMEANPRDARVPYFLGLAQLALHKTDDARVTLQRFMAIAPSRYQPQVREVQDSLAKVH